MWLRKIDISEQSITEKYPGVLDILLRDQTTQKNIIWATSNYEHFGRSYLESKHIKFDLITGINGDVIMPRVQKDQILKQSRVKNMAEVFTPSWICNAQNNLIDNAWFERKDVFNKEISNEKKWKTNQAKIEFPKNKSWKDYVNDTRLEISCGEAPYITSRYDTTTGKFIEIENRIGLLDRKLRIINENVDEPNEWIEATKSAYKNTYAYEWQGDSLLLARESMLFTFIENYKHKFEKEPLLKSIENIAEIISWNVWQMDGLKGVVPFSCGEIIDKTINLFGEVEADSSFCKGCLSSNIFEHNGIYCLIMDWSNIGLKGKKMRYIDLLQNKSQSKNGK
ncbi:MAG: restriction endonuclease subunit M [Crocinitomicaceae bacterium]